MIMKILYWIGDNILFLITLFLLAFIPLYPKFPLIDIQNTWVYIRVEDFIILFTLFLWLALLVKKKINLKTPLTLPIMIFWIIGVLATIHGIFLIFPDLPGAHANVGLLSLFRRIEYLSLFFVGYASMKNKKFVPYVVFVLTVTLLLVSLYGFGQKFLGFKAFLTMNEEYAKGLAIQLSPLARVPSTFGGQYDLAAYLVLVIPILTSMVFAFKNWFVKGAIFVVIAMGFAIMFLTVSRISFVALLASLLLILFFQKKKIVTFSLLALTILFLFIFPSLFARFSNTLKTIDILVSIKDGGVIGHLTKVDSSYFLGKVVKFRSAQEKGDILSPISPYEATSSALIVPFELIPKIAPLIVETNNSTGENLPSGTGYINLPLAPIEEKISSFYYQKSNDFRSPEFTKVLNIRGEYLVKKAVAYDLSFTTRFQGEWPNTIDIFKRNIFIGGGYGSVSLAVDNNYLRVLGEVGIIGFLSFASIFLITGIYIKKVMPEIDSKIAKNFILGFCASLCGLAINALLIDVFEASKIAFSLWLLIGICLGMVSLYQKKQIQIFGEIKEIIISPFAIISYLTVLVLLLYSGLSAYFFVGDDFTWLRWASDCKNSVGDNCQSSFSTIFNYFMDSNGFFYRPGTKVYFWAMYKVFWLNQAAYHFVSIFLHIGVSIIIFLISRKLFKNYFMATLCAFLFVLMSGYSESVFWISSTGFLFNAFFALASSLFYTYWKEKGKSVYFIACVISFCLSMLFHELGIVVPLFYVVYEFSIERNFRVNAFFKEKRYGLFLFFVGFYLLLRFQAQSHWFNGDYSYNLIKLPFNFIGNIFGYLGISLFGSPFLGFYERIRDYSRLHVGIVILLLIIAIVLCIFLFRAINKKIHVDDKKVLAFGSLFFVASLLPFLGLGNITSRYSYLSSFGFILIVVFLFEKLYFYLKSNGREIAIAVCTIVICIFSFWHLIQMQKIHDDWKRAGDVSQGFFLDVDKIYSYYWANKPLDLYFVNAPIKSGEAWVFPVGIEDAVWFVFRSNLVKVYQPKSLDEAFLLSHGSLNGRVYQFDSNNNIVEMKKGSDGVIISTPY